MIAPLVRGVLLCGWLVACAGEIDGGGDPPPPMAEPNAGCAEGCHGSDNTNAPPMSVSGATDTTSVAVGAHRAHLATTGVAWHRQVACSDCHVVPATVGAAGHMDGDNRAELTFSAIAAPGTWSGATCTVGCHGSAAWGGTSPTPTWTQVDGTQAQCGSCHGAPPPPPHPAGPAAMNCATCHPTMEENSLRFRDPARHIDGTVDFVDAGATGGCTTCHGGATSSAPPVDLAGNTAPTARGVGAHQAHLMTSTWRHEIVCSSCHVVPSTNDAPGHRDGDNVAEVRFDTLNPQGTYAPTSCATLYCHGNGRGNNGSASWITPGALDCTSCHAVDGNGMSGDHDEHVDEENLPCTACHASVAGAGLTIINATLHVNGVREVQMARGTYNPATRTCTNTGCHGSERW
ncbi:MAG: hypothetical protein KBG28_17475 [Kofleriaceae bacterium]|nr:hypothetical protein [Kofleriaceae bacterium]